MVKDQYKWFLFITNWRIDEKSTLFLFNLTLKLFINVFNQHIYNILSVLGLCSVLHLLDLSENSIFHEQILPFLSISQIRNETIYRDDVDGKLKSLSRLVYSFKCSHSW